MSAVHHHPFHRDADGVDLELDSRWDLIDPSFYGPDPSIDLHRGSYVRRTRGITRRVEPSPMNEVAGHTTGLNGRPATSTSSARNPSRAGTPQDEVTLGGGPSWGEPLAPPASEPSSSLAGSETHLEDERPSGGHRSAS